MSKIIVCFLILMISGVYVNAQEKINIVEIIDNLTVKWDETAIRMKDYQGIQNFCASKEYKKNTIQLLDDIHHWDTTLYFIVQEKYADTQDEEADATLRDIETLERDYTTENFKLFIQNECTMLKVIEDHFDPQTIRSYEKEIKKFEKELVKYLNSITSRIDIIDEHVHHLKLD